MQDWIIFFSLSCKTFIFLYAFLGQRLESFEIEINNTKSFLISNLNVNIF